MLIKINLNTKMNSMESDVSVSHTTVFLFLPQYLFFASVLHSPMELIGIQLARDIVLELLMLCNSPMVLSGIQLAHDIVLELL